MLTIMMPLFFEKKKDLDYWKQTCLILSPYKESSYSYKTVPTIFFSNNTILGHEKHSVVFLEAWL